ncbi:DUF916 and DUF3324 domain-containing protein [Enterococcus rotai]|uniref:DUF916 and DUF3324 domain-containing protein n=1 Tax=Enterococcus rotai TaxID=118060 RepID=UPI0032B48474
MKKFLYIVIWLYFSCLLTANSGYYAEQYATDLSDFSYEVILPKNQRNKDVGYYDLVIEPGKTSTVQLKLTNLSPKKLTLSLKYNSAKTNSNGVIEYGPNNLVKDSSLVYDFSDLVTGPNKVVLEPHSNKVITLSIKAPMDAFEGYVAGGIQVMSVENTEMKKSDDDNLVVNKFAYLIGMLLSEGEVNELKPELKFNSISVDTQKEHNRLLLNFSNIKPIYAEDMAVDVNVKNKATDKIAFELKKSNMRMAPNTQISLPISLKYKLTEPGSYILSATVTAKGGGSWSWEQEFRLSEMEIDQLNKRLNATKDSSTGQIIIFIVLFISLCLIVGVTFFYRNKKRKTRYMNKRNDREKNNRLTGQSERVSKDG